MLDPIWSRDDIEKLLMAADHRTPIYGYSGSRFSRNILALRDMLGEEIRICSSVKANPWLNVWRDNPADLIEVCSLGEWNYCMQNSVKPERIVFGGVLKLFSELSCIVPMLPHRVSVESEAQLRMISQVAQEVSCEVNVLLRFSSGNQFGMDREDLLRVIRNANDYSCVRIRGLHYYSGTQKRLTNQIAPEIEKLVSVVEECGDAITELEIGPGFGVPLFTEEDQTLYMDYLRKYALELQKLSSRWKITVECGRLLTADAGVYITKICESKRNSGREYRIVDGGIHHLQYYGQNVGRRCPYVFCLEGGAPCTVSVCGSLCTSSDILIKDVELCGCGEEDHLVFCNAGAYCLTESMIMFLNRDMPCVIIEFDGVYHVVSQISPTYVLNNRMQP